MYSTPVINSGIKGRRGYFHEPKSILQSGQYNPIKPITKFHLCTEK